ncbi:hypothetical protein GIB67_011867 [Kingdonia uniflora]|uniref:Exocyst subunit Exo70 family protein n=1 Tax=Kingdonia uniflora TaxID=39325 RepID=A0A7J7KVR4_9MAGN|nr:hypothetical protein GIB67_011867 [Kingdonia uniflora]
MPSKGMGSILFTSNKSVCPSSPSFSLNSQQQKRITTSPVYSYSQSMMNETIVTSAEIINKWNPDTSTYMKVTSLFYENREEAKDFLKSVKDLQRAMKYLVAKNPNSEKLVEAHNLMEIAMKRLEKEFYMNLSMNHDRLDPESISSRSSVSHPSHASDGSKSRSSLSDYEDYSEDEIQVGDELQVGGDSISEVERALAGAMLDLKSIADCMFFSGYGKECVSIYKVTRKSVIDEGIYRLGVEQLSARKINKMDWEILDLKIKNWLKAVITAVKTLFAGERILCDYVFSSSDSMRESCFSEISKNGAMTLFQFPELIAKSKKKSEKIFRTLDLYIGIADLWQDIETILSFESTNIVITQALSSLQSLGEAVRAMLYDFEAMIQKNSLKSPAQGGGVHSLTRYVLKYLIILSNYSGVLSDITAEWPMTGQSSLHESYRANLTSEDSDMQPITTTFAWLILILLCKLDGKAEHYKEAPLSYLFLANNLNYIIRKVQTSNLQFILGEEWISKHEAKVKHYIAKYEHLGWSKVLSVLPEDSNSEISILEAKNCFKRFNSAFQAAFRTQSQWVIADSKLRNEIKMSICRKLGEAYGKFYEKYRVVLQEEKNLSSLITFTPNDIGDYLLGIFLGSWISDTSTSSSRSSKHSSGWSL